MFSPGSVSLVTVNFLNWWSCEIKSFLEGYSEQFLKFRYNPFAFYQMGKIWMQTKCFFSLTEVCGLFLLYLSVFLGYVTVRYYWMLPFGLLLKVKYILIFSPILMNFSFFLNQRKIQGFMGNSCVIAVESLWNYFWPRLKTLPFLVKRSVSVASALRDNSAELKPINHPSLLQ